MPNTDLLSALPHTCTHGPVCAGWHGGDFPGCDHSSCDDIVNDQCDVCWDDDLVMMSLNLVQCSRCGELSSVKTSERHWGYCGPIYTTTLDCGHEEVDASNDTPEA